jgi:hypothetical protein
MRARAAEGLSALNRDRAGNQTRLSDKTETARHQSCGSPRSEVTSHVLGVRYGQRPEPRPSGDCTSIPQKDKLGEKPARGSAFCNLPMVYPKAILGYILAGNYGAML